MRTQGQRSGQQASPRRAQSPWPRCRTRSPCLPQTPPWQEPENQRHSEPRAASSWQRCPLLPSPSRSVPPAAEGQPGPSAIVLAGKSSPKGSALLRAATPPPQHGMGMAAAPRPQHSPARGRRERWPRAGAAGAAGALQGVGSWGARDAGHRSWQRACWSPASPDWKLLPDDGCLAAGMAQGLEAFQMAEGGGWG